MGDEKDDTEKTGPPSPKKAEERSPGPWVTILVAVIGSITTITVAIIGLHKADSQTKPPEPPTETKLLEPPPAECGSQGCWFVCGSFKQTDYAEANRWLEDVKGKSFIVRSISPSGHGIFLECGPYGTPRERDLDVERFKGFFPSTTPFITNTPDKPW